MNTEVSENKKVESKYLKILNMSCTTNTVFNTFNYKITLEYNIKGFDFRTHKRDSLIKCQTHVYIWASPTGNCQLGALSAFSTIIDFDDESLHTLFKYIYSKLGKSMLMLDINKYNYKRLQEVIDIDRYVVLNKPYISTNRSRMRTIYFNLNKFVQDNGRYEEPVEKKPLPKIKVIKREGEVKISGELGNEQTGTPTQNQISQTYGNITKETLQEVVESVFDEKPNWEFEEGKGEF